MGKNINIDFKINIGSLWDHSVVLTSSLELFNEILSLAQTAN